MLRLTDRPSIINTRLASVYDVVDFGGVGLGVGDEILHALVGLGGVWFFVCLEMS